ncbi:MAG: hypothetical protein ACKO0Z_28065 [Betaproteobacteria bacterium]
MAGELQAIFPKTSTVSLPDSNASFELKELELEDLDRAIVILPVWERALAEGLSKGGSGLHMAMATELYDFVARNSKEVTTFLSAATKRDESEIKKLSMTDSIALFSECIKVNGGFFLKAMSAAIKAARRGAESSQDLSETDTGSTTSDTTH